MVKQGDNCAVLVGEPGVGKRTMLFSIANKILEEKSETSSPIGRISIGILIIQDIIAILFISLSSNEL